MSIYKVSSITGRQFSRIGFTEIECVLVACIFLVHIIFASLSTSQWGFQTRAWVTYSARYYRAAQTFHTFQVSLWLVYRARPISLTHWKLELGHREMLALPYTACPPTSSEWEKWSSSILVENLPCNSPVSLLTFFADGGTEKVWRGIWQWCSLIWEMLQLGFK